jgi:tRNA threonylcarbamoyladenosine biosynthesis protein TsaE
MIMNVKSVEEMKRFGEKLGQSLKGGEVIELIGDIGAGKTTFTKGLATGLKVEDDVQSPTFTISRVYDARDGLELIHYDFYRLAEPGVLKMEIEESVHRPDAVTVIEWGGIVEGVLPEDRLTLTITAVADTERKISVRASGSRAIAVMEAVS